MIPEVNEVSTDVLIIGGGSASCMAAIEAAKYDLKITIVDKGRFGRSGSNPSSGGWGVAGVVRSDCGDTIESHLQDTLQSGLGACDPKISALVTSQVPEVIRETESYGVHYHHCPKTKEYMQRGAMGHSHPRICYGGPGWDLMRALEKEVLHRRVNILEGVMINRVLTEDGKVNGALGIDVYSGQYIYIKSKSVVLSAGSATGLQLYSSASYKTTGDGLVMAYEAGVDLVNLEFTEFTLVPAPQACVLSTSGLSPLMARGAQFFNASGERFLSKYDPEKMERTSRAGLVRAVYSELQSGKGPCFLDATVIPAMEWTQFTEQEPEVIRKLGGLVDPRSERFPWVPALHSFLGGIRINTECETSVAGLYAAGEGTSGMHGSNRLGGNALSACFVLGKRAGSYAANYAKNAGPVTVSTSLKPEIERVEKTNCSGGIDPATMLKRLRQTAWMSCGVARNKASLMEGIEKFIEIQHEKCNVNSHGDLIKALEIKNLALTGALVCMAALQRCETRGQHYRTDFPETDHSLDNLESIITSIVRNHTWAKSAKPKSLAKVIIP